MYIQWETVEIESGGSHNKTQLVAILNGGLDEEANSRSLVGLELGSIGERYLAVRVKTMREFHKGLFWAKVDKKLNQLCLNTDIRQAIESEISEKISRPNEQWALWGVTCVPCYD
jgi:hypothetical protein